MKKAKPKKTEEQVLKAVDKLVKALRLELRKMERVASSWRTKKTC